MLPQVPSAPKYSAYGCAQNTLDKWLKQAHSTKHVPLNKLPKVAALLQSSCPEGSFPLAELALAAGGIQMDLGDTHSTQADVLSWAGPLGHDSKPVEGCPSPQGCTAGALCCWTRRPRLRVHTRAPAHPQQHTCSCLVRRHGVVRAKRRPAHARLPEHACTAAAAAAAVLLVTLFDKSIPAGEPGHNEAQLKVPSAVLQAAGRQAGRQGVRWQEASVAGQGRQRQSCIPVIASPRIDTPPVVSHTVWQCTGAG